MHYLSKPSAGYQKVTGWTMFKTARQKQRFLLLIAFIVVGFAAGYYNPEQVTRAPLPDSVQAAFAQHLSDVQLEVNGTIVKLLPDDDTGTRHQKFIVRSYSGPTLLVAHNIDLAPRIKSLQKVNKITLFGEYKWNVKGGILHRTHHDPGGRHIGGWIDYQGKRYQ